jgi:hypothetical protein
MIWPHPIAAMASSAADGSSGFHWALGDVATGLLAVFALGALIAAWLAYRKQSSSDDHLAEQVKTQGDALAEQRKATKALADQAEAQRQALEDQQAVNALQIRLLERTLGALTRQQAEQIDVEHELYGDTGVEGLISPSGIYWLVKLRNDSPRPVRSIARRLPAEYEEAVVKGAWFDDSAPDPGFGLVDNEVIPLLASGETWGFVVAIPLETPDRSPGPTVRFTDDAGVRWQVTDDKSITPAEDGDW